MSHEKKSHFGSKLMIGAVLAVAAATFLQSKKGKAVKEDLKKKMSVIQKRLMTEVKRAKTLTKEQYENLVDNAVEYYARTKDVAKSEMPGLKKELMAGWKTIETELKSSGKKIVKTAAASGKRVAGRAKAATKKAKG